ncbi:hypothetical protein KI387_002970, partial [Taxus chinensis]
MASHPCAACRSQRKKCSEKCVLAPHFPPDHPEKFAVVRSVFGTKHIVKLLQLECESPNVELIFTSQTLLFCSIDYYHCTSTIRTL